MALGGWKEAAGTQERRNLMPVRYSARRQETEVQAKLQQAVFLQALMEEVVAGRDGLPGKPPRAEGDMLLGCPWSMWLWRVVAC